MNAEEKAHAITKVLERIPAPVLPQVAQVVDVVLTIVEAEQAAGTLNVADLRASFDAAREPWQQIRDRAVASAADLGIHAGSGGD